MKNLPVPAYANFLRLTEPSIHSNFPLAPGSLASQSRVRGNGAAPIRRLGINEVPSSLRNMVRQYILPLAVTKETLHVGTGTGDGLGLKKEARNFLIALRYIFPGCKY